MTEPTRSARQRRRGRRPGWVLLTALLVLAIGASSALVFTNRVELLKLAVILALWAAVVAAFVSVVYRRQSDADQAKVRDLKLVYDLQLDREISARREYELTVETHLRRELVSELRAQAADEVAGLRAELAALRASLEILFDADLSDRPALEHDRAGGRSFGRVTASRIDAEERQDVDFHTDESPIIDVPEEPHPTEYEWMPPVSPEGGAHRRPSEMTREGRRRRPDTDEQAWAPPPSPPPSAPPTPPRPTPPPVRETEQTTEFSRPFAPEPPAPEPSGPFTPEPPRPEPQPEPAAQEWQPAPAEGQFIPPGTPGSNWVSQPEPNEQNGSSTEYVGRRRAPEPHHEPAMSTQPPAPEPPRGRHSAPADAADPGKPHHPPTLATESAQPPPHPEPHPEPQEQQPGPAPRHRSLDENPTGGQSVADLLARLQATPSGGGRRRRREE